MNIFEDARALGFEQLEGFDQAVTIRRGVLNAQVHFEELEHSKAEFDGRYFCEIFLNIDSLDTYTLDGKCAEEALIHATILNEKLSPFDSELSNRTLWERDTLEDANRFMNEFVLPEILAILENNHMTAYLESLFEQRACSLGLFSDFLSRYYEVELHDRYFGTKHKYLSSLYEECGQCDLALKHLHYYSEFLIERIDRIKADTLRKPFQEKLRHIDNRIEKVSQELV